MLHYDIEWHFRGRDMLEMRMRAVQLAAREEIFLAIAQGALKARAGRLAPESSMEVGSFKMMVVEDENGEGCAVQVIESRKMMEDLALEKAQYLDKSAEDGASMSDGCGWKPSRGTWGRIYTSGSRSG